MTSVKSKYSIVVATRGRADALRLSIPRMLSQSREPSQLVVADSSDDHALIAETIKIAIANRNIDYTILHTEPGSSKQRNEALKLVKHPVTLFPDDDSMWFPDVAEHIMRAYETDNSISAVCAAESPKAPEGFPQKTGSYAMTNGDKIRRRYSKLRNRIENWLIPDPLKLIGSSRINNCETPSQNSDNIVLVEWMTGFSMSFRTEVIKEILFDESLGLYALHEDIDASLQAWTKGKVVAALNSKVYHHRYPGFRANGRTMGAITIINRAYVAAKNSSPNDPARNAIKRYSRYTLLKYLIGVRPGYGWERFKGAFDAYKEISELITCTSLDSNKHFLKAFSKLNI